jgi:hypothetical protein
VTVYAPSDFKSVNIPAGCGHEHTREIGPDGYPVSPWAVTCPDCEAWLLTHDDRWVTAPEDVRETFDERKSRERFESRGLAERDALMALAMARMAGVSQAEIPPSVSKMLSGLPAHLPAPCCARAITATRPGRGSAGSADRRCPARPPPARSRPEVDRAEALEFLLGTTCSGCGAALPAPGEPCAGCGRIPDITAPEIAGDLDGPVALAAVEAAKLRPATFTTRPWPGW